MLTTQLYSYGCVTILLQPPSHFAFLSAKKKPAEAGLWWFLLRGISYPRLRLGGQCEQFVVCGYVASSFYKVALVLSTLLLLTQSILCQAHYKHTVWIQTLF